MDAKEIARELIRTGHGKEEIIANLNELGISGPERFYEDAMREEGKGVITSEIPIGIDKEKQSKDILDTETKPIFESGTNLFGSQPQKPSTQEKKQAERMVEDIPKLEITSIGDEGESVKDIGQMLGKNQKPPQVMSAMPISNMHDLDAVERKLDDLIAKLNAVYEIDRQILQANREVLLRLKSDKQQ